ncbi:MAG TPA: sulfatase-like hydrolase/transferase, partial [Caldilineaceae bacterium]|nr:sulfatase-like hydrolase/transferase [Caldilineaceae bacterium]
TPEYLDKIDPEAMPDPIPADHTPPAMIEGNVRGNRGDWNGVDYSEFNDDHKRKIRTHYAGLVKQIDDEIGDILAALERSGQLENTLIIFASDHGDYLGDHGMIGKSSFYEASCHVPLILAGPGVGGPEVSQEIVALLDVTASLLHLGGAGLPGYLDSRPLPGLGAPRKPHDYLFGATSGGWMIYDGRWKLCKYATGDILFFDLASDPTEDRNLAGDPAHLAGYLAMDAALTQELLRSVTGANFDRRVYTGNSMWNDPDFGKRGWQRTYPQGIGG